MVHNMVKTSTKNSFNIMQIITGDGNNNNNKLTFIDDINIALKHKWRVDFICPPWKSKNYNSIKHSFLSFRNLPY